MIDVSNPAALKSIELSDDSGSDRGWKIRQTQRIRMAHHLDRDITYPGNEGPAHLYFSKNFLKNLVDELDRYD